MMLVKVAPGNIAFPTYFGENSLLFTITILAYQDIRAFVSKQQLRTPHDLNRTYLADPELKTWMDLLLTRRWNKSP